MAAIPRAVDEHQKNMKIARRTFDHETLKWVREIPPSQVLDRLRDDGRLFWRRDRDFVPEKDARTVRLHLSLESGFAGEILVAGANGTTCALEREAVAVSTW